MSIAEKLTTIAENEQKVYEAGYNKGKSEGGGDSYYDTFWDSVQANGTLTNYQRRFMGRAWNVNTFNPKHTIAPVSSAYYMFHYFNHSNPTPIDLSEFDFDWSGLKAFSSVFADSNISDTGFIDGSNATSFNQTFATNDGGYIGKVTLKTNENATYSNILLNNNTTPIFIVTEDSVIGKDFSASYSSKLTAESVRSILLALKDYSGTENELVYKVTLHATAWATVNADSVAPPIGENWQEYVTAKGWKY